MHRLALIRLDLHGRCFFQLLPRSRRTMPSMSKKTSFGRVLAAVAVMGVLVLGSTLSYAGVAGGGSSVWAAGGVEGFLIWTTGVFWVITHIWLGSTVWAEFRKKDAPKKPEECAGVQGVVATGSGPPSAMGVSHRSCSSDERLHTLNSRR